MSYLTMTPGERIEAAEQIEAFVRTRGGTCLIEELQRLKNEAYREIEGVSWEQVNIDKVMQSVMRVHAINDALQLFQSLSGRMRNAK